MRRSGLDAAKPVDEKALNQAKGGADEHPECEPEQRPSSDFSELSQTDTPFSNQQCDNDGSSDSSSSSSSPGQALVSAESPQQDNMNKETVANTPRTMTDSTAKKVLTTEEQARLSALKSMLNASNTRYQQATRNRRPVFAAGLKVKVVKGDFIGEYGTVLDADYIENRALISLNSKAEPRWIGFRSLGHAD